MGNSLRCCLACVLPFGAFDLIRVVHLNGQIEEFSHPITVRQILAVHPNHILTKPSSDQNTARWIAILSQETELKRGGIYFLVPNKSKTEKKRRNNGKRNLKVGSERKERRESVELEKEKERESEKPGHHRRMSSRLSDWRPNLDCISEDL